MDLSSAASCWPTSPIHDRSKVYGNVVDRINGVNALYQPTHGTLNKTRPSSTKLRGLYREADRNEDRRTRGGVTRPWSLAWTCGRVCWSTTARLERERERERERDNPGDENRLTQNNLLRRLASADAIRTVSGRHKMFSGRIELMVDRRGRTLVWLVAPRPVISHGRRGTHDR